MTTATISTAKPAPLRNGIPASLLSEHPSAWRTWLSRVLGLAALAIIVTITLTAAGTRTGQLGLNAISTGSMTGTSDPGSLVIGWRVPATDLNVGDVITTESPETPGALVTHRIVDITHTGDSATIRLKGDANPTPDVATYNVTHAWRAIAVVPHIGGQVQWLLGPGLWVLLAWGTQTILTFVCWPRRREVRLRAFMDMRDALDALDETKEDAAIGEGAARAETKAGQ